MKHVRNCKGRQGGASLIEALIAILVFSLGILGTVGLLAYSVRASNDVRYRSEAANLAGAIVADMWATRPTELDVKFGTGGTKLDTWQNKATALLPAPVSGPPLVEIDLAQPGLSLQSRTALVTVSWQLPGSNELHSYLLTAQIGKNP
jgi:type IV pilus assembly protein PilV